MEILLQLKAAQKVIALTIPTYAILSTMACCVGYVALAYFYGCDPIAVGSIRKQDQIVVLLVGEVLGIEQNDHKCEAFTVFVHFLDHSLPLQATFPAFAVSSWQRFSLERFPPFPLVNKRTKEDILQLTLLRHEQHGGCCVGGFAQVTHRTRRPS